MSKCAGAFRYVAHERIRLYEMIGWYAVAELGPVHGHWSVLMSWPCGCRLAEPLA